MSFGNIIWLNKGEANALWALCSLGKKCSHFIHLFHTRLFSEKQKKIMKSASVIQPNWIKGKPAPCERLVPWKEILLTFYLSILHKVIFWKIKNYEVSFGNIMWLNIKGSQCLVSASFSGKKIAHVLLFYFTRYY